MTKKPEEPLPSIPDKRYFSIGEVSDLCRVKSHVLRYWEQEFPQLKPAKRRGNRRYYQRYDIEIVRDIRTLLYDQGFTIQGARLQLDTKGRKLAAVASEDRAVDSLAAVRQELESIVQELGR
ncbi:MerR family transcriptional regulator [Salinisphaera sp. SPP-AMP-43]|uniref:MerR family transcriptional regulator n=1 Tax=Salinisphaera sp. SPP-AMP-43 TaxID=3121288 RepID=UPI003C6E6C7C